MRSNEKRQGIEEAGENMFKKIADESGMTLLEVIIVVVIITITAGIAVGTMITQIPHYRLNGAARDVVSDMNLARQNAVRTNSNWAIRFVPGADTRYTIWNDANNNGAIDAGEETVTRPLIPDTFYGLSATDPPGVPVPGEAALPGVGQWSTFAGNIVSFRSDGIPAGAGAIYISNTRNENVAISVNAVGRVRLWPWRNGAWN